MERSQRPEREELYGAVPLPSADLEPDREQGPDDGNQERPPGWLKGLTSWEKGQPLISQAARTEAVEAPYDAAPERLRDQNDGLALERAQVNPSLGSAQVTTVDFQSITPKPTDLPPVGLVICVTQEFTIKPAILF